jgi:2-polyprenyl-3-methyl-5-hydroxy-6-metoxy-1,4-benzoquinol methylase
VLKRCCSVRLGQPLDCRIFLGLIAVLVAVVPVSSLTTTTATTTTATTTTATTTTAATTTETIHKSHKSHTSPAVRDPQEQDKAEDPRQIRLRELERVRQLRSEGTIESQDGRPVGVPAGLTHYKGREIAQTMHYLGAPWLTREERESEEKCSIMLANCKIRPGMNVCDMGCGNGFYTFRLAEMVGPEGLVYAVDIQPEMLVLLREEMERRGVDNIVPILGSVHHPRLPAGQIDAILLADVYHEFSHPEQMLAEMRQALKPDGFAILLEFRTEDPQVPIKELHKMSKAQIMKEWPTNGFKLLDQFDRLTWQHMMFFGRDETGR